jgi:DNA-binding protein YbaB
MFDKVKEMMKLQQIQGEIKKKLEQIFVSSEKNGVAVLVRGDKRIEKITINGEDQKQLRDMLNDAMKEAEKKAEKQMRGQLSNLGIPGL